jgi:hypothetical protein
MNNHMRYNHTQTGTLMIVIMLGIIGYLTIIMSLTGFDKETFIIVIVVLAILSSFCSLNVIIDESHIKLKFGYGLIRKKFLLNEIISAEAVKNPWYCGWGIRFNPALSTWIFNVSGFDAVEIKTRQGKTYRIGTDDPRILESSVKSAIKR